MFLRKKLTLVELFEAALQAISAVHHPTYINFF